MSLAGGETPRLSLRLSLPDSCRCEQVSDLVRTLLGLALTESVGAIDHGRVLVTEGPPTQARGVEPVASGRAGAAQRSGAGRRENDLRAPLCVASDFHEARRERVFPHREAGAVRRPGLHRLAVRPLVVRDPLEELQDW